MLLKQYLKEKHPDLSNRMIKRALEQGACKINGKLERFATRKINPQKDRIDFRYIKTEARGKLEIKESRIVYEDEEILVYNKEAGYLIMQAEGKEKTNLHHELKKFREAKFLEPVHRLDKDTSGLVIFTKNKERCKTLMDAFKNKKVYKEYDAIVDSVWSHGDEGRIENHLKLKEKKGAQQIWQVAKNPQPNHKHAITNYRLIKTFKNYSQLRLIPETGRTHQLRVHMSHLRHPILGEKIYAENFQCKKLFDRHLLHAAMLKFEHCGQELCLEIEPDWNL